MNICCIYHIVASKLLATLGTDQVAMASVRAKPRACTTEEPQKYDWTHDQSWQE